MLAVAVILGFCAPEPGLRATEAAQISMAQHGLDEQIGAEARQDFPCAGGTRSDDIGYVS